MGGAAGHLQHLYDNRELTFAEIKNILSNASEGSLESVTEKLDGLNLVFSYSLVTDALKVARSAGDIKTGGMSAEQLASKFQGRGNLSDAFNDAFDVLQSSMRMLSDKDKKKTFGQNANLWYSMEIIYPKNPNVINYDSNSIVFHKWPVFQFTPEGKVEQVTSEGVDILNKNINQMQAAARAKNWRLVGPNLVRLKKLSDGTTLANTLVQLDQVMSQANVEDSSTIGDYIYNRLSDSISDLALPSEVSKKVIFRIMGESGYKLTDIKKSVSTEKYNQISELTKKSNSLLKSAILPLEKLVFKFSIEILRGFQSSLISSHDVEVARLKNELTKTISALEATGDAKAIEVLRVQMEKLESVENISSSAEGVVFMYKGNAYKFTGAFAPANQILGLFKYGKPAEVIESILDNYEFTLRNNERFLDVQK